MQRTVSGIQISQQVLVFLQPWHLEEGGKQEKM